MLPYLLKQVELAVRSHLDNLLRPAGLTALQYTAPAAGEPDDEHRLGDPRELHRDHMPAPQSGLETPSQVLPPVRAGGWAMTALRRTIRAIRHLNAELLLASEAMWRAAAPLAGRHAHHPA